MPTCLARSALIENVDYLLDKENGLIQFLSTGALGPTVAEFAEVGGCGVSVEFCREVAEDAEETPSTPTCEPAPDCAESIASPSCPVGYVWGGKSCRRAVEPQVCSTGYFWNGAACVKGTNVVCAPGYSLSAGACVLCAKPVPPTLTPAVGQITLDFNVGLGLAYNVFRSIDGQNYKQCTTDVGIAGSESFNDTEVESGLTYFYYVSVFLGAGCGYVDGNVASAVAV